MPHIALPSSKSSQIFLLLHFLSFLQTSTSFPHILYYRCWGANYSPNSTFETNLQTLFQQIPRDASSAGFASTVYGVDPGAAYGLALCRGDISDSDCKSCLHMITLNITNVCPFSSNAAMWFDKCFLRYSDARISSIPNTTHWNCFGEPGGDPEPEKLNRAVTQLMMYLSSTASNNSNKFSVAKTNITSYITIYGLAQCTRDLSPADCSQCLDTFAHLLVSQNCTSGKVAGRVLGESCNVRYDESSFYNITALYIETSSPTTRTTSSASSPVATPAISPVPQGKIRSKPIIIAMAVSAAAGVVIVITFVCLWKKIAKASRGGINQSGGHTETQFEANDQEVQDTGPNIRVYTIEELNAATENFSSSKKLGEGGYGEVYEGAIEGNLVAIKRLYKASKENEQKLKKELVLVANIEHPNILKLLGYCFGEDQYLFIYEHMPNGSLDRHWKDPASRRNLNWTTRFKIIKGIAHGLFYLHHGFEKNIIHVDLKIPNILLSRELTAKIADFDLLRTFEFDETHQSTENGYGTPGYMAPEVNLMAPRKHYSLKSDVYSFGIMILEIVTGERIHTFGKTDSYPNLMSFVWYHWNRKRQEEVIDPYLDVQIQNGTEQIVRCIHIGLLCIQHTAAKRPDMLQVLDMLNSKNPLPLPSTPGFLNRNSTQSNESGFLKSVLRFMK